MTVLIDGPDLAGLRAERRAAVFEAMGAADVDVLVMGRPAEVAYATGARQLWVAGSRPFGPAGIAVRETGRIHLLATSEDGVPPEVGADDLFGLSWNPVNLMASVGAIPGLAGARRIATTSSTPGFDLFIRAVAPEAEVVDGAAILGPLRARKRPQEVACIEQACDLAASALEALVSALRPGVTERQLLAVYLERLAELGVPTPPTEGVVCATSGETPVGLRRVATHRPIAAGDLVVLDVSADVAGYEGGLGTTRVAGSPGPDGAVAALAARCREQVHAIADACRPGATGGEVREVAREAGVDVGDEPILVGVGMGVEPPVITAGIGDDAVLEASMVVAVSVLDTREASGAWYERRLVLVGAEPRFLGPDPVMGER